MNPTSTQGSPAPESSASAHSTIRDFQWIAFIDEISRRLEKEETFTLMHSVLVELFHFDRPFFAELNERARNECMPFTFTGEAWYPSGDPARVVFSRRTPLGN